jgi:heme A synthase
MTTAPTTTVRPDTKPTDRDPVFASLTGLIALVVLLQFVFAGVFLRYDGRRDASTSWIDAHAWGAHIGTVLAVAAALYAIARLRARKDLLIGSIALAVLFLAEAYIGGAIRDDGKDAWTAIHIPVAFLLTALVVWLPARARK